jgi:hypothetical protein
MNEIWKPIKGYEGLYEVSNLGNVKTLGNFPKLRNRVIGNLKPGSSRGYLCVIITNAKGERKTKLIHRLVAENFLENPDNLRCVNHKDEDKRNNSMDNLEWCTDQYNKEYSNTKVFLFLSPDGVVFETPNMSRFCRENNLQQGNLSKVVAGTRKYHKGWSLA